MLLMKGWGVMKMEIKIKLEIDSENTYPSGTIDFFVDDNEIVRISLGNHTVSIKKDDLKRLVNIL